jgi:hypothetical protein
MNAGDFLRNEWARMDAEPWVAEITRGSWATWHIDPVKGVMGLREGYMAFGSRKHAEKVARRKLARLERSDQRRRDATTITGGTT